MCGITGIAHWDGRPVERHVLKRMADTIVHRGPDEEGLHVNDAEGRRGAAQAGIAAGASVGLGHRRLSIIDLSSGQQPLSNEDGTVWIAFNGEIYNFLPLKRELAARGHRFRTGSDTEIIVHAYEEWGAGCLARLNGMFAFAIWDERRQQLFVARDRLGKKPLYYHSSERSFVFGSELKAVLAYPGIDTRLDATAVADYFKYLYVPDPKSIFAGIRKLPPAHYLIARKGSVEVHEYWDVTFHDTSPRSEEALEEELFELLQHAVRDRLMSEVPLGAFLSGGVDSSGVVALMAQQSSRPVVTCSIGFDDPEHDESHFAAEVARSLRTDHSEYIVDADFIETVRRLPGMFDEPFADASAVPTYYVCKMARQRVTVALSGDGGDEAFAGYDKYVKDLIERQCGRILPHVLLKAINLASANGTGMRKRAHTLTSQALRPAAQAFYASNSFISDPNLLRLLGPSMAGDLGGYDPSEYITRHFEKPQTDDHLSKMLYTDLKTYLPGDILVKVDRTSMANSLEVRAPLLDYRVIEFAATLPNRLKIRRGSKKYLLKKAFSRLLPEETFRRPKHGFTVPLGGWFRNGLLPLAQEVFFESPETSDLLDVDFVRRLLEAHRAGRAEHGTLLWSTLNFALWYRELARGRRASGVASP